MWPFLNLVQDACARLQIELVLSPDEVVYLPRKGVAVAGYFDEKARVLAVGGGRSDWVEILAHEFAHLQQFIDGEFLIVGDDPYDDLEDWYSGKDLPAERVAECIGFAMSCEHDAERRAVGTLSRYGLCTDIKSYIREANGYVLRHLYAKKYRRWPTSPEWGEHLPNETIVPLDEVVLTRGLEKLIKAAQ